MCITAVTACRGLNERKASMVYFSNLLMNWIVPFHKLIFRKHLIVIVCVMRLYSSLWQDDVEIFVMYTQRIVSRILKFADDTKIYHVVNHVIVTMFV